MIMYPQQCLQFCREIRGNIRSSDHRTARHISEEIAQLARQEAESRRDFDAIDESEFAADIVLQNFYLSQVSA